MRLRWPAAALALLLGACILPNGAPELGKAQARFVTIAALVALAEAE